MIRKYWNEIKEQQDVRQNLSKLRQEIKKAGTSAGVLYVIAGSEETLIDLLHSEDAKTRKNAALLMGDLGKKEFLRPVYEAYEKEQQRFVRSSYLAAMKNFDYRNYLDQLKQRLDELSSAQVTPENEKHHMEELRELSALIVTMEGISAHTFHGWDQTYDMILITNRKFAEVTRKELLELAPDSKTKVVGAGVMARVPDLRWLPDIRTYQEILFSIPGMQACPMDPVQAAEALTSSRLMEFLNNSHRGKPPYYFRVGFKSKRPLDERSHFVKKLSAQIEKQSGRELINTPSRYEMELRFIENKEGTCNLLVKLYTLKDERFWYRLEVMPTSIKPVNAALAVALAKDYMKEDAQVLDPFCGVGTMLIERHRAVPANTTYGIDIQAEAIEKARVNTKEAHQVIHYINRDFFRFSHEYLFDEVITNMPFAIGRITEDEVFDLYQRFFGSVAKYLKENAVMILYSHDCGYVENMAPKNGFEIAGKYELSKKEGAYVFILQRS